MSAFDDMVAQLERRGFRRETAEIQVRAQYPELSPEAIEKSELTEAAREREVEAEGDRIMLALGFEVLRLSQARPSKVVAGLPDRRYYRRPRVITTGDGARIVLRLGVMLWWEAKAEWGVQRPDQVAFQELVEACGETYVLGTHKDLLAWLVATNLCRLEADGSITALHPSTNSQQDSTCAV